MNFAIWDHIVTGLFKDDFIYYDKRNIRWADIYVGPTLLHIFITWTEAFNYYFVYVRYLISYFKGT